MFSSKIKKTIQNAAKALTGYKHRAFIAEVAIDYFAGNARKTEREMGWGRGTIEIGMNEIRTGIRCIDHYSGRGNKRSEEQLPTENTIGNILNRMNFSLKRFKKKAS